MPASRKRNKGKDRKAKQLAKKEENERAYAHKIWRSFCGIMQCDHGHASSIPDDHPVSSFIDQFFINSEHKGMSVSQNLNGIFQTHTQIWNDESYRALALDILVHIGTNMMLSKWRVNIANALYVAQFIVVLEHYGHYNGSDNSKDYNFAIWNYVVVSKWRDMHPGVITNERDGLKFYRRRISCKCLKKMHLETRKSTPKMGICWHCKVMKKRVHLFVCSRCIVQQYCSRQCQVADWQSHEARCDWSVSIYKQMGESRQIEYDKKMWIE